MAGRSTYDDRIDIPKDYKYLDRTSNGSRITDVYQDHTGLLGVVFEEKAFNTFGNLVEYDPNIGEGYWGHYGFDTREEAIRDLLGRKPKFTRFDPHSYLDVMFEYDSIYNYNRVSKDYLKAHDHKSDDFDPYYHRVMVEPERNVKDKMDWHKLKGEYKQANRPGRKEVYNSYASKGSSYLDDCQVDAFGREIFVNGSLIYPFSWEKMVDTFELYLNGDTKRAVRLARYVSEGGDEFVWYSFDVARLLDLPEDMVDFEVSARYPEEGPSVPRTSKPKAKPKAKPKTSKACKPKATKKPVAKKPVKKRY